MFNLLMAGDDAEWQVPIGLDHLGSFPIARFLEYTDPAIEVRFKPVTTDALSYLADIPAVFMSELQRTFEPGKPDFVRIQTGRIWNLTVMEGEIHYHFRIDAKLNEVAVLDRNTIELAFGLGKWEITRTHWAIKNKDLPQSLFEIGFARGLTQPQPFVPLPVPPPPPPPPPPPLPIQPVINSLQDYMAYVLGIQNAPDEEIFYRGHTERRFRLVPSLFRKNVEGGYLYRPKEETLVRELLTAQATEFSNDSYMLDRLVRMQHYGLPTRLLDVTSNPLVALYFCCSSPKYDQAGNEIDGEVIMMKTRSREVKFYDSDTVSCITNLCLMTDEQKNRMDTTSSQEIFNLTDDCKNLINFIRREKPYFDGRIVPSDLERILFVRGRNTNERITSQAGAFLLFGKDSILPETGHSTLNVARVTVRNKLAILDQLAKLNIKSSTIYPGIEKATAEIAKKHELK